jgi:hypothetical protein
MHMCTYRAENKSASRYNNVSLHPLNLYYVYYMLSGDLGISQALSLCNAQNGLNVRKLRHGS